MTKSRVSAMICRQRRPRRLFFIVFLAFTSVGSGKAAEIRQQSGLFVETVEKKPGLSKVKSFQGDASKVIIQGTGLKKGFVGRAGAFTLDVKDAGMRTANARANNNEWSKDFDKRPHHGADFFCMVI